MKQIKLLDATLREGEQQAGVRFCSQDKIRILRLLEQFQIDLVEVGHPGVSTEDEEICKEVGKAACYVETLMHARAVKKEVQAVHRAGGDWVGIWASINPISLASKFHRRSPQYVKDQVAFAIDEAKKLGLRVRFTIEDASRTNWQDIYDLGKTAVNAGADRISLADTVGCWEPQICGSIVKKAVEGIHHDIEVHLHNDLGLALANSLAAMDAGASVIDTSILGIGERAGIVDLIQLSVVLTEIRKSHQFPLEMIPDLSQTVQIASSFRPDHLRPIVGRNAYTHSSRYHTKAVQESFSSYEFLSPERVGRTRKLIDHRMEVGKPKLSSYLHVGEPFEKGASELLYHRNGPGTRWVLMDHRIDPRSTFYVIQRFFQNNEPEKHVDRHTHHCDSVFLFWGDGINGSGLTCCVQIGEEEKIVTSPASIFIPAGVEHSYYYIEGNGIYTNIVLAPEYNQSLL